MVKQSLRWVATHDVLQGIDKQNTDLLTQYCTTAWQPLINLMTINEHLFNSCSSVNENNQLTVAMKTLCLTEYCIDNLFIVIVTYFIPGRSASS